MTVGSDHILLSEPYAAELPGKVLARVLSIGRKSLALDLGGEPIVEQASTTLQIRAKGAQAVNATRLVGRLVDNGLQPLFEVTDDRSLILLQDLMAQIRKDQHIDICLTRDVEASDRFTGFERLHFMPEAMPELGFEQIDTRSSFLGRTFDYPILIAGMTGGVSQGAEINRKLALAAQKLNIPMGIGSQRMALDNSRHAEVFDVKKTAPDVFLLANLGFAQLRAPDYLALCRRAVDMVGADALAIHLNVLQELIQVEGDRDFSNLADRLAEVCNHLEVPIVVKEVGCGISPETAQRLVSSGVAAVDIGGRGGTSWGYIEGLRSNAEQTQALARSFRDWGIPTAFGLTAIRQAQPDLPLIATGGIRDGLMVAKAVALGANMVGIGLPLLRAAIHSQSKLDDTLQSYVRGLKTTMVATGSACLGQLSEHIRYGLPFEKEFVEYFDR